MGHVLANKKNKQPSLFSGAVVIGGTIVGAGMFSLPIMMAGSWFSWALVIFVFTWFCMLVSGLMLLEANLNYPVGSSFNTVTKDLLGNYWNIINGITVAFVLYILTYAYISAGGSIISLTLKEQLGFSFSGRLAGFLFAIVVAVTVWISTEAVSRMTALVLGIKILTFFLTFGSLMFKVDSNILINTIEPTANYIPYLLAALPFCLASFGFHGNVPSLMKYYGKEPKRIQSCLIIGSLIALILYIIWLFCTMGNIPRTFFQSSIPQSGNIDVLISALGGIDKDFFVNLMLIIFSNFAVASSFLGVSLGLFDYLADLFKFDNSRLGRLKTILVTFFPPMVLALFFPNGFIYAIGFAGLAATIWAVIVPALLAKESRKRFGSPMYRVIGGNKMIGLILLFGVTNIVAWALSALNVLPVYN